jgi:hypothetical protein
MNGHISGSAERTKGCGHGGHDFVREEHVEEFCRLKKNGDSETQILSSSRYMFITVRSIILPTYVGKFDLV